MSARAAAAFPESRASSEAAFLFQIAFKLRRMLGENLRLGEPDARFFSLSSHKEERGGERRPFGTPLSGSLPARASRGESEPGLGRHFLIRAGCKGPFC